MTGPRLVVPPGQLEVPGVFSVGAVVAFQISICNDGAEDLIIERLRLG